jgi:hypothetical protein
VVNQHLCTAINKIQAFPTMRLFKNGEPVSPDYRGDRTVEALVEFAASHVAREEQLAQLPADERQKIEEMQAADKNDHPACMMSGTLQVNRVPGHFLIEARSIHHNLNPKAANLSHIINHLSFGNKLSDAGIERLSSFVSKEYFDKNSVVPVDGNGYVNLKQHQAFHHYIKVSFELSWLL